MTYRMQGIWFLARPLLSCIKDQIWRDWKLPLLHLIPHISHVWSRSVFPKAICSLETLELPLGRSKPVSTSQLPSCEVLLMAPDQKITRATSVVTKHWLDMAGCSQEQSRMNLLSACVLDFACRILSKEPSSAACPSAVSSHKKTLALWDMLWDKSLCPPIALHHFDVVLVKNCKWKGIRAQFYQCTDFAPVVPLG